MSTVAILGCGYVGCELGRRLLAEGTADRVVGVRRSVEGVGDVTDAGIEAVQGDLTDEATLSSVPDADVVVFAASAGRGGAQTARELYVDGQQTVLSQFGTRESPPDRYVYTASTGVYGDHDGGWVDEETPIDPATEREQTLADAERIALEVSGRFGIDGTVVRFAGLYGPGRYRLERYLDGPVTEGVTNLTHRDDGAGAIAFLLAEDDGRDEVVLAVDDEPVSKWRLADWLADRCERPRPPKQPKDQRLDQGGLSAARRRRLRAEKRCDNGKLRSLGYELSYPTFREGYRPAIREYTGDRSE